MAKRKQPRSGPTKKQVSRRRREERQLRWIWIALTVIVVAVVAIIAVGAIAQATRTMAVVNGEPIKVTDYHRRVRYYYYALGPDTFQSGTGEDAYAIHQMIADQLIREKLIRQAAEQRGISATAEEIEIELEETWFRHYRDPEPPTATPTVDPGATPTPEGTPPAPTPTPDTVEAYEANYRLFVDNVLRLARVDESYVRRMAEVNVLRNKLQQAVIEGVPAEEEQVHFRYEVLQDANMASQRIAEYQAGERLEAHARHILVETEEQARTVLQRLQQGEGFATLAAELSIDSSNADQGGDLGWFARGEMVDAFEQVVFEADTGLYPEPVETEFGYHVIEILDRQMRPVDPAQSMFDAGWYSKDDLSAQFGMLFAEIIFHAEIGLHPDPVPTDFGVAVVQIAEREMRELSASEQEERRYQAFEEWLDDIREEGDVENNWTPSMIPSRL